MRAFAGYQGSGGTYIQRLWVIWGQCCPRVAAAPSLPNSPITQLSPYFTRKPGKDSIPILAIPSIWSGDLYAIFLASHSSQTNQDANLCFDMHNAKYLGHISKNQLPSATGLDSQKGSPRDLKKVIANLASPQPPVLTFDFIQQRRGRRTLDKSRASKQWPPHPPSSTPWSAPSSSPAHLRWRRQWRMKRLLLLSNPIAHHSPTNLLHWSKFITRKQNCRAAPVNTDANNDRCSALLSNRKDGKAKQTDVFTHASLLINKRGML